MVQLERPETLREQRWHLEEVRKDYERKIQEAVGSSDRFVLNRKLERVNAELEKINERIRKQEQREKELAGQTREEPDEREEREWEPER